MSLETISNHGSRIRVLPVIIGFTLIAPLILTIVWMGGGQDGWRGAERAAAQSDGTVCAAQPAPAGPESRLFTGGRKPSH